MSRLSIQLGKVSIDDSLLDATLFVVDIFNVEYVDIFNYLSLHQFPNGLSKKKKKRLVLKTMPYTIIGKTLYKMGKDELLCHCVSQAKIPTTLEGCHVDVCGEHFVTKWVEAQASRTDITKVVT